MILQNISRAIREQNYYAVALEFVIVIAGVVIGFQITAWNGERAARSEEARYLLALTDDVRLSLASLESMNGLLADQQTAQERIAKLERQKTRQRRDIYDVEDDIDAKRNQLIDQLTQRMTQQVQTEHLFTLQWTVT
jgi:hypothetical protein